MVIVMVMVTTYAAPARRAISTFWPWRAALLSHARRADLVPANPTGPCFYLGSTCTNTETRGSCLQFHTFFPKNASFLMRFFPMHGVQILCLQTQLDRAATWVVLAQTRKPGAAVFHFIQSFPISFLSEGPGDGMWVCVCVCVGLFAFVFQLFVCVRCLAALMYAG